jgi:hypothetical protein
MLLPLASLRLWVQCIVLKKKKKEKLKKKTTCLATWKVGGSQVLGQFGQESLDSISITK